MAAKLYTVYVVGGLSGKPPVKIGYARNVKHRLSHLQTGSPRPLELAFDLANLTRAEARRLEGAAHKELEAQHIRGEWFAVSADKAVEVIWGLIDQRVYTARALTRFDLRGYLRPEQIDNLSSVAFRTIENNALR